LAGGRRALLPASRAGGVLWQFLLSLVWVLLLRLCRFSLVAWAWPLRVAVLVLSWPARQVAALVTCRRAALRGWPQLPRRVRASCRYLGEVSMVSDPRLQIAFAIFRQSALNPPARDELLRQVKELADLLDCGDVCDSCWRLYSTGTRGKTQHDPENCSLEITP
jgi:hypothetical protein